MINAALIGSGKWGQRLVDSSQTNGVPKGKLHFTCVVARTPSRIGEFAERHALAVETDYDRALDNARIQAIVVATPHGQHFEHVQRALSAGKHVFVEKPITLRAAEAQACVDLARTKGLVLAVGLSKRFLAAMPVMRQIIRESLGEILHLEGVFTQPFGFSFKPGNWRLDEVESPLGGLTSLGIHVIDAFINLHGRIRELSVKTSRRVLDVPLDDTTVCQLDFVSGAFGTVLFAPATARCWQLQAFGTEGWVAMRDDVSLDINLRSASKIDSQAFPAVNTEEIELEAFAQACLDIKPYPVPLDEVTHGIEVIEALIRAQELGAPVTLSS